jgi:hypothetical protein
VEYPDHDLRSLVVMAGLSHSCPVEFPREYWRFFVVMAGLVPAIHIFPRRANDVDGRHEGGHDDERSRAIIASGPAPRINRTAAEPQGRP